MCPTRKSSLQVYAFVSSCTSSRHSTSTSRLRRRICTTRTTLSISSWHLPCFLRSFSYMTAWIQLQLATTDRSTNSGCFRGMLILITKSSTPPWIDRRSRRSQPQVELLKLFVSRLPTGFARSALCHRIAHSALETVTPISIFLGSP